jgi:hypothetical protein
MTKINYGNYIIFVVANQFVVQLDNSFHPSLISAKCHIDYLTK